MLRPHSLNEESRGKRIWLWGGIGDDEVTTPPSIQPPLTLSVCLRLSLHKQRCTQCGVMGLGLQQQTLLRLTSLLQLHLHPPSYQITRRTSQHDTLLTSHLKPHFRKQDACLLYHSCTDLHTHAHTKAEMVTHVINKKYRFTQIPDMCKCTNAKSIPLHTCPLHSKPSLIHSYSE